MNKDIVILDDFLPSYIQDYLEELCYKVDWGLSKSSIHNNHEKKIDISKLFEDYGQLTHVFWNSFLKEKRFNKSIIDYNAYTKLSHYFTLPLQIASLKEGFEFDLENNLGRGKVNITFSNKHPHPTPKEPHRDIILNNNNIKEIENMWAIIYYVNESDGDTIIYNEKEVFKDTSKYTIRQKISPKKGRMVFIKGDLFHSASNPSSQYLKRVVINYNLMV